MEINGSNHEPVEGSEVPRYVEEMLDYLIANWESKTATHLAAYVMWRLNWIHPFADGNGRTSRILSYMVMCARLGYRLPGSNTIPEQISEYKEPYYDALEASDREYASGKVDVSEMENLLESYLAKQLVEVQSAATGKIFDAERSKTSKVDFLEKRPVLWTVVVAVLIAVIGWAFFT